MRHSQNTRMKSCHIRFFRKSAIALKGSSRIECNYLVKGSARVPRRYNATPTVARYDTQLGEFIVMYDDVLSSASPSAAVLDFCHSTYGSGATL